MDKNERLGYMRFDYEDDRETEFNESVDCTYALYGEKEDEAIEILKQFYIDCKK